MGVISEGIFNLVPTSKKQTKSLQAEVKSCGTVIWFFFVRMIPNRKYILKLPHLYQKLYSELLEENSSWIFFKEMETPLAILPCLKINQTNKNQFQTDTLYYKIEAT